MLRQKGEEKTITPTRGREGREEKRRDVGSYTHILFLLRAVAAFRKGEKGGMTRRKEKWKGGNVLGLSFIDSRLQRQQRRTCTKKEEGGEEYGSDVVVLSFSCALGGKSEFHARLGLEKKRKWIAPAVSLSFFTSQVALFRGKKC